MEPRTFEDASFPQTVHRGSREEPLEEEEAYTRRRLGGEVVRERRRRPATLAHALTAAHAKHTPITQRNIIAGEQLDFPRIYHSRLW